MQNTLFLIYFIRLPKVSSLTISLYISTIRKKRSNTLAFLSVRRSRAANIFNRFPEWHKRKLFSEASTT
jgi:hypothetical protein